MSTPLRATLAAIVLICAICRIPALAVVAASGNTAGPSQSTSYNLMGPGGSGTFNIVETVALDSSSGPWLKSLVNSTGSGIASGADRGIVETLTNGGPTTWTDWHEAIESRTTINQPNDSVGFLFRENSLSVMANYGSGFVTLTQGVDYTLVVKPNTGPGGPGNVGNWETIDIFFSPSAVIETGDTLKIQKSIFEVLGDADPWRPDEAAVISQYPSPEPAGLAICTLAAPILLRRRRA